ncbi:helix-hairpin-helix domain-containing protein [Porphyromonas sp.]|uniref:ComEA family DNA-binding protein n=1 Tax=Porphyromonas sp. TaxID=1924944 RepID=UPI0026DAF485|nr:helix-hairpin-helix domain-containing protein [Porphyromonas sp.]MDO4771321.1 helix-hairpin-helix domain-containing protein [Porphyromonas sp.]
MIKFLFAKGCLIFAFSLILSIQAYAQEYIPTQDEALEHILGYISDDEERERVGELLQSLREQPLDLNRATGDQLVLLPFFDDFFVRNLLLYRSQNGGFRSIYDLKNVNGAPVVYLPLIEPYITVSVVNPDKVIPRRQRFYLGTETDLSRDVPFGDRWGTALYFQSHADTGWSADILADHDRAEPLRPLHKGIADHFSFSLTRQWGDSHTPSRPQLILGDFRINTGQGLVMGMSRSYFSSMESRQGVALLGRSVVRPHRSFREDGYLRGVAGSIPLSGMVGLSGFAGFEPLDAHVEGARIRTLYRTGIHRTSREQMYRHSARREVAGAYLSLDGETAGIGLLGVAHRYKGNAGELIYNPLPSGGVSALNSSLDWRFDLGDVMFWGESTIPLRQPLAIMAGASWYNDYWGRLTLTARRLAPEHSAPYAMPESRFSNGRNEKGINAMWHGEIARNTVGTVFCEYYEALTPDPRRRASRGSILSAHIDHRSYTHSLSVRWRGRWTDVGTKHTVRAVFDRAVSKGFLFRAAAHVAMSPKEALSKSFSIRLRYETDKLKCEGVLQAFDIKSHPLRAEAAYMPHKYYVPMLRGSGIRVILKSQISVSSRTTLSFRYSPTLYFRRPETTPAPLLDFSLVARLP